MIGTGTGAADGGGALDVATTAATAAPPITPTTLPAAISATLPGRDVGLSMRTNAGFGAGSGGRFSRAGTIGSGSVGTAESPEDRITGRAAGGPSASTSAGAALAGAAVAGVGASGAPVGSSVDTPSERKPPTANTTTAARATPRWSAGRR